MHLSTFALYSLSILASISSALHVVSGETVIRAVAPSSTSCAGAQIPAQCRNADQAALAIAKSFDKYSVTTLGEIAAIIAVMAFESGEFKYQKNLQAHPGQGTRNMQSGHYNVLYAQSIPTLASSLTAIKSTLGSDDYKNAVLELLIQDDALDFGSGAWFLTSQCTSDIRSQVQAGTQTGFETYMLNCVGVPSDTARLAYWQRGIKALNASK